MPDDFGTRRTADLSTRSSAESVVKRVYLAVESLCIGGGDARSRVREAVYHLVFLREDGFPKPLQADYKWIISQATKFAPDIPNYKQDGCIDATMCRIKNFGVLQPDISLPSNRQLNSPSQGMVSDPR